MNDQTKAQITGVHTVGVPVTGQDRALEFYVGTLGLAKRLDVPYGEGGRWIEVAPPGGGRRSRWSGPVPAFRPAWRPASG